MVYGGDNVLKYVKQKVKKKRRRKGKKVESYYLQKICKFMQKFDPDFLRRIYFQRFL